MRNTFKKCATAEGAVGVAAAGLETGPVDLALVALVGVGTVSFHGRFTEGANMINSHPNSGRIYICTLTIQLTVNTKNYDYIYVRIIINILNHNSFEEETTQEYE